ncbi:hypothetical protein QBC34DRAFT_178594 [Podospora aff. communis PSN243]|uniref:Uncharacterized protein n=1 Tax=Podospora aff. communis PSN243 TaxID=3040156 RepID=A0AAV9H3Q2_9PEZI|nr:hypothetical protein QBC34DRAFT_178594 [Podospora aff. communis PSN243]
MHRECRHAVTLAVKAVLRGLDPRYWLGCCFDETGGAEPLARRTQLCCSVSNDPRLVSMPSVTDRRSYIRRMPRRFFLPFFSPRPSFGLCSALLRLLFALLCAKRSGAVSDSTSHEARAKTSPAEFADEPHFLNHCQTPAQAKCWQKSRCSFALTKTTPFASRRLTGQPGVRAAATQLSTFRDLGFHSARRTGTSRKYPRPLGLAVHCRASAVTSRHLQSPSPRHCNSTKLTKPTSHRTGSGHGAFSTSHARPSAKHGATSEQAGRAHRDRSR